MNGNDRIGNGEMIGIRQIVKAIFQRFGYDIRDIRAEQRLFGLTSLPVDAVVDVDAFLSGKNFRFAGSFPPGLSATGRIIGFDAIYIREDHFA